MYLMDISINLRRYMAEYCRYGEKPYKIDQSINLIFKAYFCFRFIEKEHWFKRGHVKGG